MPWTSGLETLKIQLPGILLALGIAVLEATQ
ncbi:MAG: hypothetical protein JWP04_2352 [Belnapia sp.]|nr:hypothetical protein [Belnapia sp.]